MGQQRGSKAVIIYDTESAFKVAPTVADAAVLAFVNESLRMSRNLLTSNSIANTRNPLQPVLGNVEVGGDITFELSPQYGRLFKHIFGDATVTGSGSAYTWTYKIGDLPVGMMIEKKFADIMTPTYFQYNGVKVNSFKLSAKTEGFIDCSVALLGAKETLATVTFDSSATDFGFTPFNGFQGTILKGGAALAVVTAIDFELNNNLDGATFVMDGTGQRYSLPEGRAEVSGKITALFIDNTLYEAAVNNTETSLVLQFIKNSGGTVGTTDNEQMRFYVDECIFQPQAPVINGPTGLVVELPFQAYYNDGANASALRAVLQCPQGTF